jgi:DNA-3-methyladenine glycosylase II
MLRGLGRLDIFPLHDSGVARSVALIAGEDADLDRILEVLGPTRGMLYFHLLLGRLEQSRSQPVPV